MENSPNKSHLHPQSLNEFKLKKVKLNQDELDIDCLLCEQKFDINDDKKMYLAHLIASHQIVIADVKVIGHFKKYVSYWKERLKTTKLEDVCFRINTNTGRNDKGESESFYLLSDNLPEEKQLREKLNIYLLEKCLSQQELERNDQNYQRNCLFCSNLIGNNRSEILNHMNHEHNFNLGHADNIVYFDEFYQKLQDRFDRFQCLFCEKIFYNKQILKEHMRKKQHKCINPSNKEFDKYYIINYLEYSKVWQDLKSERDFDDLDTGQEQDNVAIEDWNDDPGLSLFCLFCDDCFEKEDDILIHMLSEHCFDLKAIITERNLSFYNQVKLINYIRRQQFLNVCFICRAEFKTKEELCKHFEQNEHIKQFPEQDLWDQPEYYFSAFEDDNLLCILNDNTYSQDESKIKVIPEQYSVESSQVLNLDLKNLKF